MDLSVVIPAYNEENRLGPTLEKVCNYLKSKPWKSEVVVVVDGATDSTASVAKEMLADFPHQQIIERKENRGKGFSTNEGMMASRGDIALFSDADMSAPIREFDKLHQAIEEGHDVAIGSRGLKDSDVIIHQTWLREHMGKTFNLFVRSLVLAGIRDTQCGFKCFKREVIEKTFPRQKIFGFGFDVEILYLARKFDYRIAEIPVEWFNDPYTKVRLIGDSANMFLDLLRIRRNNFRGLYD